MDRRVIRNTSGSQLEKFEDYSDYIDLDDSTSYQEGKIQNLSRSRSRTQSQTSLASSRSGSRTPSPSKRMTSSLSQRSLSNKSLSRSESNYNIYDFSLYGAKVHRSSEKLDEYIVERSGYETNLKWTNY